MTELERVAEALIASLAAETAALEAGDYVAAVEAARPKSRALEAFVAMRGVTAAAGAEQLLRRVSAAAAANRGALFKALGIQGSVIAILARAVHGAASSASYAAPASRSIAAPAALCIQT